jgi:predicted Zn finger-like uncharacterized protein
MALATQCPHCRTSFRVVPDQLKLRDGLVRCGACKQIFNGLQHLLPADEPAAASTPAPAGTAASSTPAPDSPPVPEPHTAAAAVADVPAAPASEALAALAAEEPSVRAAAIAEPARSESEDPMLRMTLMDFREFVADERSAAGKPVTEAEAAASARAASEELNRDIEDLQTTLRNDPKRAASLSKLEEQPQETLVTAADLPEPEFVQKARRQARIGRALRIGMRAGSVLLLITLLGQGAYAFRSQLAASLPQSAPWLAKGCVLLGCTVGLPAQIDSVSIESSELQAVPAAADTFTLVALLRNRSSLPQSWPHLELTLTDANEKAIARRVIGPRDYLGGPQEIARGLPASSEQAVKIQFELAQLKASNYRVYVFYP